MKRVKKALEGLHAVSEVAFDPRSDTFVISATSNLADEEVRSAVLGQVVFPRLRRFLGRLKVLGDAVRRPSVLARRTQL